MYCQTRYHRVLTIVINASYNYLKDSNTVQENLEGDRPLLQLDWRRSGTGTTPLTVGD